MGKHEETKDHPAIKLIIPMLLSGALATVNEVETFINGFN